MSRKTLAAIAVSFSVASTIALSIMTLHNHDITEVGTTTAGDVSYSMVLNKNTQRIYTGDAVSDNVTGTITNERGNEFQFKHDKMSEVTPFWQDLKVGGYLRNVTPICGITSIEISTSWNATFNIYYGASYDDVDNNYIYLDSEARNHTYDLSEFKPNFFKITVRSSDRGYYNHVEMSELIINYGCAQTNSFVNATSSNETFGTVSGGGTKTVGEEVTLTATPITDYENKIYGVFDGWYDGETLLTNELSYSFTPAFGTYSYNYEAKFVEADSEEFTIGYSLYKKGRTQAWTCSEMIFLQSKSGKYYALKSSGSSDGTQLFEENKVFVSNGYGEGKETNDLLLNSYYDLHEWDFCFDSERTSIANVVRFGTDIKAIDFYLDISDSNYIDANELSTNQGTLYKYDIVDERAGRFTLHLDNFDTWNIGIGIPDGQPTTRKLVVTKVVIHYNHK